MESEFTIVSISYVMLAMKIWPLHVITIRRAEEDLKSHELLSFDIFVGISSLISGLISFGIGIIWSRCQNVQHCPESHPTKRSLPATNSYCSVVSVVEQGRFERQPTLTISNAYLSSIFKYLQAFIKMSKQRKPR